MDSARSKPVQVHLVTPEEPKRSGSSRGDEGSRSSGAGVATVAAVAPARAREDNEDYSDDGVYFTPSVRNTRKLETEIMLMIQYLRNQGEEGAKVDRQRVVDLLNRSLTAVSHWSLQAQLAQLHRSADDRQLVETNLLRKEMQALVSRQTSEPSSPVKRQRQRQQQQQQQRLPRRGVPQSPSLELSTTTQASGPTARPVSPSTPQKKIVKSPSKRHAASGPGLTDPLRLVESKKPHPRMRRTSDNPMANEYVRVFHLQRK